MGLCFPHSIPSFYALYEIEIANPHVLSVLSGTPDPLLFNAIAILTKDQPSATHQHIRWGRCVVRGQSSQSVSFTSGFTRLRVAGTYRFYHGDSRKPMASHLITSVSFIHLSMTASYYKYSQSCGTSKDQYLMTRRLRSPPCPHAYSRAISEQALRPSQRVQEEWKCARIRHCHKLPTFLEVWLLCGTRWFGIPGEKPGHSNHSSM